MSDVPSPSEPENGLTEITIQPDGRIYVQGLSRPVLEILESLQPKDPHLACLLQHVRGLEETDPL